MEDGPRYASWGLPGNGKDGFHSVPNFRKQAWDGVESVLTSAFLAPLSSFISVPLKQNILCLALAAVLVAGCQTERVEPLAVTEVTLPQTKPFAVPAPPLITNVPPLTTNVPPVVQVAPPPPSVKTNPPPPVRLAKPAKGWVSLESWSLANGLGRPQKIAIDKFAVATPQGTAVFHPGSQCLHWGGVSVWLGLPPRFLRGQVQVHELDVEKVLEPLLHRPALVTKPGRVVVIDPGHGGADGGTQGTKQQLEKDFTLDWALRLEALLRTNGWQVHLTRAKDITLPLAGRIACADGVKADLFLSLHFNGLSGGASTSGLETICTTPSGLPSSVQRKMQDQTDLEFPNNAFDRANLQYAFRIHQYLLAATHAADGGVRHARFTTVLREQRRPAVLVEGGFLSNPEEARRIATPAYRQKLAEAVAQALQ